MKQAPLYICGIAWTWELDPQNGGDLPFYNSVDALKEDHPMWAECGIVKVTAIEKTWIVETTLPPKQIQGSREEHRRQKEIEREVSLVFGLVTHPSGMGVHLFGNRLSMVRCEDGSFQISWMTSDEKKQYQAFSADSRLDAMRFFVEKRHELKLGYDFETESSK